MLAEGEEDSDDDFDWDVGGHHDSDTDEEEAAQDCVCPPGQYCGRERIQNFHFSPRSGNFTFLTVLQSDTTGCSKAFDIKP